MAHGNFEDLPRRTDADKVLCYEAFYIAKNPKYDGYQRVLTSVAFKSFDKSSGSCVKSEVIPNEELDEELHKVIIRKFVKRKVYSRFKNNIWGANLKTYWIFALRMSVLASTLDAGSPKRNICVRVESLCSRNLWLILFILLRKVFSSPANKLECRR